MQLKVPENKRELFIKTSVWNSIIEVFKEEKNIDITDYLISIQIRGDIFVIKTNKPLINTEALMLDTLIKSKLTKKLLNFGLKSTNIDIKYI